MIFLTVQTLRRAVELHRQDNLFWSNQIKVEPDEIVQGQHVALGDYGEWQAEICDTCRGHGCNGRGEDCEECDGEGMV